MASTKSWDPVADVLLLLACAVSAGVITLFAATVAMKDAMRVYPSPSMATPKVNQAKTDKEPSHCRTWNKESCVL